VFIASRQEFWRDALVAEAKSGAGAAFHEWWSSKPTEGQATKSYRRFADRAADPPNPDGSDGVASDDPDPYCP
jgi:hypothetical protein